MTQRQQTLSNKTHILNTHSLNFNRRDILNHTSTKSTDSEFIYPAKFSQIPTVGFFKLRKEFENESDTPFTNIKTRETESESG